MNELVFKEGELMDGLRNFAYSKFFEFIPSHSNYVSNFFQLFSDKKCYIALKEAIFSNKVFIVNKNSNRIEIRENRNMAFEKYLIAIVQYIKKDNIHYKKVFYPEFQEYTGGFGKLIDADYSIKDYLYACFINSERIDFAEDTTEEEKRIIDSYKVLFDFIKSFRKRLSKTDIKGNEYFENNIKSEIVAIEEWRRLRDAIITLKTNDIVLSQKIFSFFQNIDNSTPFEEFVKSVYLFFRGNFFKLKLGRVVLNEEGDNRKYIIVEEFKITDSVINFLFTPELEWLEDNTGLNGIVESIIYSEGHPDPDYI